MPEVLSELNVGLLAVCSAIALLVLWWLASAAPGRWISVFLIGIVVAAGGIGVLVMQVPELAGGLSGDGGRQAEIIDAERRAAAKKSAEAAEAARERQAAEAEARRQAERAAQEQQQREAAARAAREQEEAQRRAEAEQARQRAEAEQQERQRMAEAEALRRRLEAERERAEQERNRLAQAEIEQQRQAAERARQEAQAAAERARQAAELARREAQLKDGGRPDGAGPDSVAKNRSRSAAPPAAAEDNKDWHVVPVFYGTDRERGGDTDKRTNYTSTRGKRLEVGRALVTVPKIHKVPNIERPWVYRVPFLNIVILKEDEDASRHFTMQEVKHLSQDDFVALAREQIGKSKEFESQAMVFVHGFNTTFDYAVYRAAQLAYDLKFDGGSFVYSWPSRGEVSPFGYSADRESAEQASRYLEEFLTLIAQRSGAKTMTVIAHSMGNKLLLPVLQKLKLRNDTDVKISQIILAAPDVDRDTFAGLAREIKGLSKGGVTLYAASNDLALDASRQFWGGVARAGDVPSEGPIVVDGIDTIDVTKTSTEIFSLNHAGYAQSEALLADMRSLMLKGYRPPKERNADLLELSTPLGSYWKFP